MDDNKVWLHRFENMARAPALVQAVSGRTGGVSDGHLRSLNLSVVVGDRQEAVVENRRRLATALDIPDGRLLKPSQVQGIDCLVVGEDEMATRSDGLADSSLAADGLLTAERGLYLFMTYADCVPVLLYDPAREVVGVVHAGWRGTVAGAARQAVLTAQAAFGSRPQDLLVGIGPSIGPCCYEVGGDVAEAAAAAYPDCEGLLATAADGTVHLDLWRANAHQLEAVGVPAANIEISGLCSSCRADLFFSHRRDRGKSGRMGAVVGLRGR